MSKVNRTLFSVFLFIIASLIDWYLENWEAEPFITLYLLAVTYSAFLSGWRYGVFILILSALKNLFVDLSPSLSIGYTGDIIRVGIFSFGSIALLWIIEEYNKSKNKKLEYLNRITSTEKRYQDLIDNLDHSIPWEASAVDFKILLISQNAEKLLGIPKSRWLETPGLMAQLTHPEDKNILLATYQAVLLENKDYNCIHRLRHSDGSYVWYQTGVHVSRTNPSKPILQGITVDISSLKEAERKLLESEEKYRLLVDSIKDYAIFMLDPTGHIISWNSGAERFKGYQEKEIIGKHFSVFYPEQDRLDGKPELLLGRARSEGSVDDESWRIRKNGSSFFAQVTINAIKDNNGNLVGFSKITRDITQKKRHQKSQDFLATTSAVLSESLDYHMTLNKTAKLIVPELADWSAVHIFEDNKILQVASAHSDPSQNETAKKLVENFIINLDDPHGVGKVIRTGLPEIFPEVSDTKWIAEALGAEHPSILKDMGARSYMIVPMIARGKTFGAITFVTTDQLNRYTHEDLIFAEDVASRAAMAVDNARLFERAEGAVDTREDLLAVVSHDLRNPLGAILMSAQMLIRKYGKSEELVLNKATSILKAGDRMNNLIEDLLNLAKIEAGHFALEKKELPLKQVFLEVQEMMEPLARERGVNLRVQDVDENLILSYDYDRLMRVFSNLVGNAIKFTPEGGEVEVRINDSAASVVIEVCDTGQGIPEHHLPHIFDRFWQAKQSAKKGAGLGLSIAKGIVEGHNGKIWAESTFGRGTSFFFLLPK